MSRSEVLRLQREKVMANIAEDNANRTKWLVELMDIDDEMEEMEQKKSNIN